MKRELKKTEMKRATGGYYFRSWNLFRNFRYRNFSALKRQINPQSLYGFTNEPDPGHKV